MAHSRNVRHVNLFEAASVTDRQQLLLTPPKTPITPDTMNRLIQFSLPPTDSLSPMRYRELCVESCLPFADLNGNSTFAAPVIDYSPIKLPCAPPHRPPCASPSANSTGSPIRAPNASPFKPGFLKIEHSNLSNMNVREENASSHSSTQINSFFYPIISVKEEIPEETDWVDFQFDSVTNSPPDQYSNLLLDQNENVLPTIYPSPLDAGRNHQPIVLKTESCGLDDLSFGTPEAIDVCGVTFSETRNFDTFADVSVSGALHDVDDASDDDVDVTGIDVSDSNVNVASVDVDVDNLIDDGDINITLSSWDDDRTQTEEQCEYPCSVCAKTFRRRSALSFHLSLHSSPGAADHVDGALTKTPPSPTPILPKKDRTFLCEHCGLRFTSVKLRTKHLLTCDRASQNIPIDMMRYIATAPDGRLKCALCSKLFNHKSTLRTHIRVHTGEKPCKCRFCGKYYRDHSTLSKHYRVHTNEKPYQCPECSRCFSQSGNMRRHIIHVHKIHLPPDISIKPRVS